MTLREHDNGRIEERLRDEKKAWDAAPLPAGLDEAVYRGLLQARRKGRLRTRRAAAAMSAALVVVLLLGMVRVSPAFAAAVAELPGLSGLVSLVAGDSGLEGAVRNDFVQPVNVSDSHDGVMITVNGIIADDTRLNILYTVKLPTAAKHVPFKKFDLFDAAAPDKPLPVTISFGSVPLENPTKEFQGRIDVNLGEEADMPEHVRIDMKLFGYEGLADWSIVIPVDKARFEGMKEVIPLEQAVTAEGQRMLFKQATIYPTSIAVDVEFDKANSKRVFWLSDLVLVTDTGEELRSQGSMNMSADRMTLQFESSFFSKPKHLTLRGTRWMALDKSKLEMKLDLEKKEIVQAPDDKVRLVSAKKTGTGVYEITLAVKSDSSVDRYGFTIVDGPFRDAAGTVFNTGGYRTSSTEPDKDETNITFEVLLDKPYTNPLAFNIVNYPSWIEEPFEVKLK
ncbi:DUF4179 domain-containing protein [Paenibacillus sacheonensis]|uniref:DUF4179 domain-containing protein n=1 Tax=Paenibacillus sacheonensis TaxID=742054 RepID=A0A7X4YUP1_9BACL|nr:DUF4179 domain-containing protein [Paenibacillus sacheonensis]MBM7568064.1 hypothetical protein [Paenibacillus sacheonensis]NBC72907.1 DUF4179 domain-containing protein [Paenibacillus sacheonensis]